MGASAPDAQEINTIKVSLESIWQEARSAWVQDDSLYDATYEVRAEEDARIIRPPTGRIKVDGMVDSLVTAEPVVKREPQGTGEANQERADRVERWSQALLRRADASEMVPPFKQMAKYAALYGYMVGKIVWDDVWAAKPTRGRRLKQRLREWETETRGVCPIRIEAPHPTTVLLDPSAKEPEVAIETSLQYAGRVREQYPQWESTAKGWDTVEVTLYWDKDWRVVMLGGDVVVAVSNGWGFVPYVHAFAGFGKDESKAMRTGPNVAGQAVGILRYVQEPLVASAEYRTALHYLAMRTAFPRKYVMREDAAGLAAAEVEAGQGGYIEVRDWKNLKWEEIPPLNQTLIQSLSILEGDIDAGTYVGEVTGERTQGVATAYQHAMILSRARMRFGTTLRQLNRLGGLLVGQALKMVDARDEPVTISGITLRPEDVEDVYDVEVSFEEGDEQARRSDMEIGMRMVGAGLISQETYLQEFAGIGDTTDEQRKKTVEAFIASPPVQMMIIQRVQQEWARMYGMPPVPGLAPGAPAGAGAQPQPPVQNPAEAFVQPGSPEEAAIAASQQQQMGGGQMPMPPGVVP